MRGRKKDLIYILGIALVILLGWLLTLTSDSGQPQDLAPAAPVAQGAQDAAQPQATPQRAASPESPAPEQAQTGPAEAPKPAQQQAATQEVATQEVPATPPPTAEERAHATDVLDFCNTATAALNDGWLGQADVLAFFTRVYLGEWQLPKFTPRKGRDAIAAKLTPQDGMFAPEEKKQLGALVQTMLKQLDAMMDDYRELEEYVLDPFEIDDGKRGKRLGASLQKHHAAFAAARTKWLELVRQRARSAEDVFLHDHPLKRQIVAARHVFVLFGQIANVLGLEKVDRERLLALHDELAQEVATAAAPPFPDRPYMERPFRGFVREAERFVRLSQRGLESGYDNELKRQLNGAMTQCRENYNAFVRVANREE